MRVVGDDAVTYLQGQLSQDVAALAVGAAAPSFVLAPDGKVIGWGRVFKASDTEVLIDVDPGAGALWGDRLRRFLMRTKAEVTVDPEVTVVAVRGVDPTVPGWPTNAGLPVDGWLEAGWPGESGVDLVDPAASSGVEPRSVVDALVAGGFSAVDESALEMGRIRAGVPRWGAELTESTIPAAVGQWVIDASVSFTKGCYTGQELVARIDSRGGHVPFRLVGVLVSPADDPTSDPAPDSGDAPAQAAPAAGAAIDIDDREVGHLTSVATLDEGSAVCLAMVARAVEVPETGVDARVGDRLVRLVPLPISPTSDRSPRIP